MQIIVGTGEKSVFYVHQNLLRSHSPFFDAALSTLWREGKDGRIKLPDDEPAVLKAYIQFLYSGDLTFSPIRTVRTTAAFMNNEDESEYIALAELYALGEKLMDRTFKNRVIDRLFTMSCPDNTVANEQRHPIGTVVDMIYKSTVAGSPARRLMVELYFWKGAEDWVLGRPEDNNTEFLMDLTQVLLRRTNRRSNRLVGDHGPDPFDDIFASLSFHEVASEEPATSKKRKASLSV